MGTSRPTRRGWAACRPDGSPAAATARIPRRPVTVGLPAFSGRSRQLWHTPRVSGPEQHASASSSASSSDDSSRVGVAIRPRQVHGSLLLADIGGYTGFLQAVSTAHRDDAFADGAVPDAYGMVSSLLDGIVGRVTPPFTLSKIEGDAVFAFATDAAALPRGGELLGCLQACYSDFRSRLGSVHDVWTCRCDACARVDTLDLKFILHAGPFIVQPIAGSLELVGTEVVMAHRLLKNRAAELVGHGAYALLTEAAASLLEVPSAGSIRHTETYEHYEPVDTLVFPLRA